MKSFYLTIVGRDSFIMLNPEKDLKNKHCNSAIFENKEDADKDQNIFKFFNVPVKIIGEKLDRRTKEFKNLKSHHPYFSTMFLPEIKERFDGDKYPLFLKPSFKP